MPCRRKALKAKSGSNTHQQDFTIVFMDVLPTLLHRYQTSGPEVPSAPGFWLKESKHEDFNCVCASLLSRKGFALSSCTMLRLLPEGNWLLLNVQHPNAASRLCRPLRWPASVWIGRNGSTGSVIGNVGKYLWTVLG